MLFPVWGIFIIGPYFYYFNYRLIVASNYPRKISFFLALFPLSILLIKRTPQREIEIKKLSPLTRSLSIVGILLFILLQAISRSEH